MKIFTFILVIIIFLMIHQYIKLKKEEFISYNNNSIPKIIIQTYHSKDKIPAKVYDNIKIYAPEYKHYIYDDNDCKNFLKKYFKPKILNKFNRLRSGAHKADLFRYCYLYIKGGVYLDIKTELILPLSDIFKQSGTYTVLGNFNKQIYQGVIATRPKNPIFLEQINFIINKNNHKYADFIKYFYLSLEKKKKKPLLSGLNIINKEVYYLFKERCSTPQHRKPFIHCKDGNDRYGFCCFIYNNEKPIIKTRFSDYPW